MNGVHDMGGMDGFGKIEVEQNEPQFHARWESRVLAMQRAMGFAGAWHIDHARYAQERLPPHIYLSVSYYEKWALAMEKNAIERGYITKEEMAAGHSLSEGKPLPRKFKPEMAANLTRSSFFRPPQGEQRFNIGDRVRTNNNHPATHTRLPRYARDKVGTVERCHGCHLYPDSVASNLGDNPQWLYTVVFDGRDLWGPDSDPTLKVSIEAFEPYIELA